MTDRDFDFDHWAELAVRDPDAFERQRAEATSALIDSAPAHLKDRLQGLQWQIDCLRNRSEAPMATCIRISRLMWGKVLGDKGLVENLHQLSALDRPRNPKQYCSRLTVWQNP